MVKSRALRRHNNERIVNNRFKLARHFDSTFDVSNVHSGKFRKTAPFDCGKAQCFICHGQKLLYKNSKFKGFREENYEDMASANL